ncbi:MAG: 50S ribosomal protein L44e [Promethearchaeota archaeon]
MKVHKIRRMYCPRCKTHKEFKVSIYKAGKANKPLSEGQRRYMRHKKGYGGQPKPIFRKNAKINKKITPLYTCSECGLKQYGRSLRQKKFEISTK